MTIVGTRPEIIRLSRVISLLDATVEHVFVHTGQNYDRQLSDVFLEELRLPQPKHFLNIDTSSLGVALGEILSKTEKVLKDERPDAVVVLGDTNSCISALMAKRMHIPVFHMEAGNRCFDERVPEETNRRMIDHISDFNLVYTEHARRNLLSEGLHPSKIFLTGSPMREVLNFYAKDIEKSKILESLNLTSAGYFLASIHREETVDYPERLESVLQALVEITETWGQPIIVSTHPRTRKRIADTKMNLEGSLIKFCEPFGFFDYNKLQMNSKCVLSDSGTISEESTILRFPAITLRESTERPEANESAGMITSGLSCARIVRALHHRLNPSFSFETPESYKIENTSNRVLASIISNVHE